MKPHLSCLWPTSGWRSLARGWACSSFDVLGCTASLLDICVGRVEVRGDILALVQVLDHMDFIGITEHMPLTLIALQTVLGLQDFPHKAGVLFLCLLLCHRWIMLERVDRLRLTLTGDP